MPSLTEVPAGKLKSSTTRRLQSSLGTVRRGEVCIGVGKGLCEKGPAVAPCESSVTRNESMASEKRPAEEWLDFEGVGGDAEQ